MVQHILTRTDQSFTHNIFYNTKSCTPPTPTPPPPISPAKAAAQVIQDLLDANIQLNPAAFDGLMSSGPVLHYLLTCDPKKPLKRYEYNFGNAI
eukprot:10187117-Ditylum_brightwellii.AAC.1